MNSLRFILGFSLLAASLFLPGCKDRGAKKGEGKTVSKEELLALNQQGRLDYSQITFRGQMDVTDLAANSSLSINYRIILQKDSAVLSSLTKFGLEFVRALVTEDSAFLRRMDNKEATLCDFGLIQKTTGMDLDFALLQDFLTGETHLSGDSVSLLPDSGDKHWLGRKIRDNDFRWGFNRNNYRLETLTAVDSAGTSKATVTWGKFLPVGTKEFPHLMEIQVENQGKKTLVAINHSKVALNEGESMEFRIPKSYTIKYCNEK